MFLKLQKGKQKEIIQKAIIKAGSERKLCKAVKISKGALHRYKFEIVNIPKNRFLDMLKFLNIDLGAYKAFVIEELPDNWGRVKGGINCVARKKEEGTFQDTVERLKKVSSKLMKQWHKNMRENHPREYHIWQYERFKKVGRGYIHCLVNGIKVRNLLEKRVGDYLIMNDFRFEYEPYLNIKGKVYFPDFKVGNKVIEVTEWRHPDKDKMIYLKNKINLYRVNKLKAVFFIPKTVRKFYKGIEGSIISTLPDLKKSLMPR